MSIVLNDVSYIYSKGTAFARRSLDHVNFSVASGEWVVIMGQTGSGKSTLLQHFNGLLKPQSGQVVVDGQNIHGSAAALKEARKKVGMVFQYPEHQIFGATVFEEVAYGPENYGLMGPALEKTVRDAMEMVGLGYEKYKDRSPYELSGGEKRRVALAGVLATNPKIIALDEPTAGLDYTGREQLIRTISSLNRDMGLTVIWVTHEIMELGAIAHRVTVMDQGRIALDGKPREVLYHPDMFRLGLDIPLTAECVLDIRVKKEQPSLMADKPLTTAEFTEEIKGLIK